MESLYPNLRIVLLGMSLAVGLPALVGYTASHMLVEHHQLSILELNEGAAADVFESDEHYRFLGRFVITASVTVFVQTLGAVLLCRHWLRRNSSRSGSNAMHGD